MTVFSRALHDENMKFALAGLFLFIFSAASWAQVPMEAGVNIVTYDPLGFRVDNTVQGQRVRRLLEKIRALGIDVIIFNFRALMIRGTSSDIRPVVPVDLQGEEEAHLKEMVLYARSLGLDVAFRPIMLVVGPKGEFPYVDRGVSWWHGNIRPTNPTTWFQSFFSYHERYMKLAKEVGAKWYSFGAEMHSMTSGLGSRASSWRFGYPELWLQYLAKARQVLGPSVKLTYGINYTDQYVLENGQRTWGGELRQWHYNLTFAAKTAKEKTHQTNLRNLWKGFDFIGIDYYRALGSPSKKYPDEYLDLILQLNSFSHFYAKDLDLMLTDIQKTTGVGLQLALQEVGYQSVEKCFTSPYSYEDGRTPVNYLHQAVAWDSLLSSLWQMPWPWMRGVGIWQVLMDDDSDLKINGGFSPLGKEPTEHVLKKYFYPMELKPILVN